ncbi:DEAD/DEAH box helicase [Flavobacterium suncheonense]|uniref:RNA helicase n=1 Tax=Flavobacterium suncheonense GH29-5 = DSM 17707 TaxID=1121899 RepID=A0A0A2MF62_9FLAO|nr:DEAD/DEAH box helicase [Flavobacterium suncheonense]KGO90211.1 RNA helicase [Flavobacterium suncheonense GH29-5 = DSM 17707]
MQLKKINPNLQKALIELGLTEANEMQQETFSTIKSGADAVIQSVGGSGKTTTIVLNVIQRLEKAHMVSPRALIIVEDKGKMLEMLEMFSELGKYTDLRVYGTHDKSDMDYDKNQISVGIDVLVGTPNRLNDMFATAGYDVNQLKMFVVDDADVLFKNRMEPKVTRISDSIAKTQRLFFCSAITEKVEIMADKIMIEPLFFEMDEEE